jgi:nicotinamidase-related amidase
MRTENTALVVIDVQLDYFRGGAFPLWGAGKALKAVKRSLAWARGSGVPVFFIKHEGLSRESRFLKKGTPGCNLHPGLEARPEEPVLVKHHPDSFLDTDLEARLKALGVSRVVWTGMITWMCVDTTVRSAKARGFESLLVRDATASGWLKDKRGIIWPWRSQRSFLAALGTHFATLVRSRALAD